MTPSMVSVLNDPELHQLLVVYPGSTRYTLRSKVEVISLVHAVRGRPGLTTKEAEFHGVHRRNASDGTVQVNPLRRKFCLRHLSLTIGIKQNFLTGKLTVKTGSARTN